MIFKAGRRIVLGSLALACAALLVSMPARAAQDSRAFVQTFGNTLVSIVNSPIPMSEKKVKILPLVQQNVDIDAIGRYCMGRYWKLATPDQRKTYLSLFHDVLVNTIIDKLGAYRGVTFTLGAVSKQGDEDAVQTTLMLPQQPPADVKWIVSYAAGAPKVVDMIGEGASLRNTERDSYAAFIGRNGGDVATLIKALQKQVAAHTAAAAAD
ncbi:MAG: ABC transporter substrate-binding protein [Acetobacter sp.]|uniref:MlaC/ttg2D family ABC transporter substrate-binding protein n=1 Tax=Acetobacter sp. TaxID=440 RepID=UPI0039EADB70